jgi:hypothetical protein
MEEKAAAAMEQTMMVVLLGDIPGQRCVAATCATMWRETGSGGEDRTKSRWFRVVFIGI